MDECYDTQLNRLRDAELDYLSQKVQKCVFFQSNRFKLLLSFLIENP
jgi:hypothetical protein